MELQTVFCAHSSAPVSISLSFPLWKYGIEALSRSSENDGLLPWVYHMIRLGNALHPDHVDEVLA